LESKAPTSSATKLRGGWIVGPCWLLFGLSLLTFILDALEVIKVRQDELELLVLVLSFLGAVVVTLVYDEPQTTQASRSQNHADHGPAMVQPEPAAADGNASIFVFDYDRMSDSYGAEAFEAIDAALAGSPGFCAFMDGELEDAAGGPSRVPRLLMGIRDNGWVIRAARADSPLVLLATLGHLYAYVAAMWTNHPESITALGKHLTTRFPNAYLGALQYPRRLDLAAFHDVLRPLHLPVRATYIDGHAKADS
jgi:hypothetical protein